MGNEQSDRNEEKFFQGVNRVPIIGPLVGLGYGIPRAIVYSSRGDQQRARSTFTEIPRRVMPGLHDLCAKGPWMSLDNLRDKASLGDLVEINEGWFSHFALYIGNGRVINVDATDGKATKTRVIETSLESVSDNGNKPVRVFNNDAMALRHFDKRAKPVSEIIAMATEYKGKTYHYELIFRNCEYYATLWRFGKGFSTQVCRPTSTPNGVAFDGLTGVLGAVGFVDNIEDTQVALYMAHDSSTDIWKD